MEPRITFGKYKGTLISEIPTKYLHWIYFNRTEEKPFLQEKLLIQECEKSWFGYSEPDKAERKWIGEPCYCQSCTSSQKWIGDDDYFM